MQIIVLNSTGSDIQKNSDSIAIRIAYLFAEKIGVSGSIKHDLAFLYRISKAPLKDKIDFVANYSNGQIPDFGNFFYDFKKVNQTFINTRNKSKQHIATFKKSEHIFMEGFNVIFRAIKEALTKCGFLELEKLFAGGVEFSFLTDSKDNENEEIINIIKSLSLDFDEKNNRKMFILTNHFFQLPFAEKYNYVNISDANASSKEAIWIEPIFTIPNLQQLSSAQLKVIRINLNQVREMFCNKADKWIDSCVANKNFEERKELLQSEIFPFFTEFGVCFNKEENIKHLSKTVDVKEAIEICIGEIPYQLLLDYYSHYKIIDNDALAQIKISQEKDERYNNRWPVLFYRSVATNSSVYDVLSPFEETILPVKKSIKID